MNPLKVKTLFFYLKFILVYFILEGHIEMNKRCQSRTIFLSSICHYTPHLTVGFEYLKTFFEILQRLENLKEKFKYLTEWSSVVQSSKLDSKILSLKSVGQGLDLGILITRKGKWTLNAVSEC